MHALPACGMSVCAQDKAKVRAKMLIDGRLNADIVGQSVQKLAEIFGISVPKNAKVLIGEAEIIGDSEPLAHVSAGGEGWGAFRAWCMRTSATAGDGRAQYQGCACSAHAPATRAE